MAANGQDGAASTGIWYYAVGSERQGPVPEATLGKLLASGEISAETYVWKPGMDNWLHLADVDALRSLVSGLGADAPVEAFVEEDTAFTPSEELAATHSLLAAELQSEPLVAVGEPLAADGDPAVAADSAEGVIVEDTVIESLDDLALGGGLASSEDLFGAEPDALAASGAESAVALGSSTDDLFGPVDDEPFSVDLETLASVGLDEAAPIAASAGAEASSASGVDIFANAQPEAVIAGAARGRPAEGAVVVGAHARRQNSVLFSLDDLGRDAREPAPSTNDQFVTDTSGLIDIRAIAQSQEQEVERPDPFGGAMLGSPRAGIGTVSVPIVERRSGLGPWILAAAALLLIGGGAIAYFLMSGQTSQQPGLVAEQHAPAPVPVDAPTGEEATKPATEEAAAKPEEAPEEPAEAVAAADDEAAPGDGEAAADDEDQVADADAADDDEEPAADAPEVAAAATATTPRAATRPRTAPTPPPTQPRRTAPAAPVATVEAAPAARAPSGESDSRVNALLDRLNNPSEAAAPAARAETANLPAKLSAAQLRETLRANRARFSRCGDMVTGSSGPVRVSTSFVIQGASGQVTSARVVDAGGTGADVQNCVVTELRGTTFGRFSDASMTVNFPIQLL